MGMIFEKVPLKMLLDSLLTLFNAGADFVDVVDGPSHVSSSPTLESVNNIGFIVRTAYLNEDIEDEQEFMDNLKEERYNLQQMEIEEENYTEDDDFKTDSPDINDIIDGSI